MSEQTSTSDYLPTPQGLDDYYYFKTDQSFKDQLIEFFTKYRPGKLKHVEAIAKKFKGQEEEVLDYMYFKYVTQVEAVIQKKRVPAYRFGQRLAPRIGDTNPVERKIMAVSSRKRMELSEQVASSALFEDEAEPKKGLNKGLIIGVLVVLLLAVLLFVFKDKIFGAADVAKPEEAKVEELLNSEEKISKESLQHATNQADSVALVEKMLDEGVAESDSAAK